MTALERWSCFETALHADVSGISNPFTDVSLRAEVTGPDGFHRFDGFYDGGDVFKIRYMPREKGVHHIRTYSNLPALNGLTFEVEATDATGENHGPVDVDGMHFRYADGSRCFIMGTTAYVWHHRPAEVRAKSLESFSRYGFNKIRMLFFPKQYSGGYGKIDVSYEPPMYPFEGTPGHFDFRRPNPAYFAYFEDVLRDMMPRNILADVILFHPYDFGHWNLDGGMDEDGALLYLRYLIARIASFRNVWWSLANEYDIDMTKGKNGRMALSMDRRDWDVIGEFVKARDPSGHPISCHNIPMGWIYPDRTWMSHVSYQHPDTYARMLLLQQEYKKPVIDDEYQYEGNVPDDWGNSSGALELERHWRSAMAGGYATHGEAFIINGNNKDIFWAYGGEMVGESPARLKFLREIMEACPFEEMTPDFVNTDSQHYYALSKGGEVQLIFMRDNLPGKHLWLGNPEDAGSEVKYKAIYYDLWNCKVTDEKTITNRDEVPITEWTAVRLERIR